MNILKYENHLGESIELNTGNIDLIEADLFEYEWGTNDDGNLIKEPRNYTIVIEVNGDRETKKQTLNKLFEIFEKDTSETGKLYYGNEYIVCSISGLKGYPGESPLEVKEEITVMCKRPMWITKKSVCFYKKSNTTVFTGIDYPYDYPYDYAKDKKGTTTFLNDAIADTDFELLIFGPIINPYLRIGQNEYKFYTELKKWEYLTVKSKEETITKTIQDGRNINEFKCRSKIHSVFEKIKKGYNIVTWSGEFDFKLTTYSERSQPKWK